MGLLECWLSPYPSPAPEKEQCSGARDAGRLGAPELFRAGKNRRAWEEEGALVRQEMGPEHTLGTQTRGSCPPVPAGRQDARSQLPLPVTSSRKGRAGGGWAAGEGFGKPAGPGRGAFQLPDDPPVALGQVAGRTLAQGSSPGAGAAKTPWEAAPRG